MNHASNYKPIIYPIGSTADKAEIDRAQSIDPTGTTNREKVEEIGRSGVVGYLNRVPTVTYRLTQLEYGSMEFWRKVANKADSVNTIELDDFKTPYFDIAGFMTDDDGTFTGTVVYPALRLSGFTFNIGEPDARIERTFDFNGEKELIWQGANQYYIYVTKTMESADVGDVDIDLSANTPAEDPDNAGVYMFRVIRVRSGINTELTSGTDYTYTPGTQTLTVSGSQSGDLVKIWHTSAVAPSTIWTPNDSDVPAILADSVSIYLFVPASGKPSSTDYVYRLQSVNIETTFDREDLKEVGNRNVVQRGFRDSTVTVSLGRMVEQFTIEEVLAGQAAGYGKLDLDKFTDSASLVVKVFDDNTKTNFKYGFKITGLSPTEVRLGANVNEYTSRDNTLEAESLYITTDTGVLGI